jgi:DHA1 family tetracycline resistance protein-like MFS transporter
MALAFVARSFPTAKLMNTTTTPREPLPRGFWVIWSTVALDMVGFGIIAPILGRYADRFGANGFQVGLLFASFSLAQMVFAPILGRWSDRVGRKPVIVISLLGTALGSFITGAAGALWVLFAGRLIDGASGASVSVAQSAIVDIATKEQRARMLGLLGMAFGIGFVFGPAIGGLAALGGPHIPFYVAGTLALINAVAAMIRVQETRVPNRSTPSARVHVPFRKRRYGALAGVGFFSMLAFSGFEATFSLFGGARFNLTEASTAFVFLGVGIVMSAVQGSLIGPLTNRFGSLQLLRNGLVLVSIGLLFLGAAVIWPTLIVALLFMVVGAGISNPSLTALVADSADDDRRGEALGIQQSATALARVIGPPLAGLAFDHVGIGAPYTFGALIYVFAIGIAFRKLK